MQDIAKHIRQTEITPPGTVGEGFMIHSQLVQDRRPEVVHRRNILDCVVAQIVGRAKGRSPFHTSASQPDAESVRP